MEKTRNSNVELLRLVLMAFVVLLHFNNHSMGGAFVIVENLPVENSVFKLLEAFCCCAVNCFMIVSGYFLYTNVKIRFGKIVDILLIVIFYRFFDFFGRVFFLHEAFSIKHFIACFLPANYFAIFYVVCYLFSPFIAKQFRESSEKTVNFLMGCLLVVFIIIPTFLDIAIELNIFKDPGYLSPVSSLGNGAGYTIVQFFTMLCLGMWIRKTNFNPKTWICLLVYCVCSLFIWLLESKSFALNYDFIFNVLSAVSLFLLFNKIKLQNKFINFAAKSCFAIFCIHTGQFANTVWKNNLIQPIHFENGILMSILWMLLCVSVMFFACLFISFIFRFVFGRIKNFIVERFPMYNLDNEE